MGHFLDSDGVYTNCEVGSVVSGTESESGEEDGDQLTVDTDGFDRG